MFEVRRDVLREAQVALPAAAADRSNIEPQAFPLADLRKVRDKAPVAFRRLCPIGRPLIVGIPAGDGQLGTAEIFPPPIQEVFFQSHVHQFSSPVCNVPQESFRAGWMKKQRCKSVFNDSQF